MSFGVDEKVLFALGGLYGLLIVATLVLFLARDRLKAKQGAYEELAQRIGSWWAMIAIFTFATLVGRTVNIVFFAFVSFLALKEYFSMIPTRRADRRILLWAYLAIPLQYYWVGIEWYGMFIIFIPVYMFLFLPLHMVIAGETRDYLRGASTIQWGLMMMVFAISHVAFLLVLPVKEGAGAGGAGLVLYLVFLTQINDVAQYIWGKMLGRHKIVPTVSPNKTWEGFLGGAVTTTVLATLIAGFLTPMNWQFAALSGLLIALTGFIGDVNISALKRDLGVKDTGALLPGHGGIIDRIDSLTFTAPLFFHFIHYFYV